jgi:hypothetical protein
MQPSETVSTNGRPPSPVDDAVALWELDGLRSLCSHQALLIRTLMEAMSTLRTGATALRAENAELRAQLSPRRPGSRP